MLSKSGGEDGVLEAHLDAGRLSSLGVPLMHEARHASRDVARELGHADHAVPVAVGFPTERIEKNLGERPVLPASRSSIEFSFPLDEVSTVTFAAASAVRSWLASTVVSAPSSVIAPERQASSSTSTRPRSANCSKLLSERADLDRTTLDAGRIARVDFVRQEVERFPDQGAMAGKVEDREVVLLHRFLDGVEGPEDARAGGLPIVQDLRVDLRVEAALRVSSADATSQASSSANSRRRCFAFSCCSRRRRPPAHAAASRA